MDRKVKFYDKPSAIEKAPAGRWWGETILKAQIVKVSHHGVNGFPFHLA
jgi:hypothetical protein